MGSFLDFFSFKSLGDFSIKGLIYWLSTLFFLWLVAFILARGELFIKHDEEIKVWFGWLCALILSLLISIGYLILVAIQSRSQVYYSVIPLLMFILLGVAALNLSNKIRDKLSLHKSKRS